MSRLLICTVGTSLLTNREDRPWGGWRSPQPLPELATVTAWLKSADRVKASAETNTLNALGLAENDAVVLLHSDTPEGHFCAEALKADLGQRCRAATLMKIEALNYQHLSFAQRGLRSLVSVAIKAIRQANEQQLEPLLCATGGFKAEIAFLNLIGVLLQIEVFYIHEQFRELVRLPRLPLAWDAQFVVRHRDFFEWIDVEPRQSAAVESWLAGRPELRALVQDDEDGHTYLNAAGDLLYEVAREQLALGPRVTWPAAVALPPEKKDGLSSVEHHRPTGWEGFIRRLCAIDCVERVTFDHAHGGTGVKILDGERGAIGLVYARGGESLPLRVETTARGEAQTTLVADYLRRVR